MASENVKEFNTTNWEQEVLKSDQPVLVDFWATWCMPCRRLSPVIDRIADQFAGRVKVGKLNTEESPEVATDYNISGIPQLLVFKGGQENTRVAGLQSESEVAKMLDRVLAS